MESAPRAQWGSRVGFVLAAAGSAVGLGNVWRFPYTVGEHGGGAFVLLFVLAIAFIGLPVLMAEFFLGRSTQLSPVGAYRKFSSPGSPWMLIGWMGVAAGFIILSYYSVVAGWCMHYAWVSVTESFVGQSPEEVQDTFVGLVTNPGLSTMWHLIFMGLTISIVVAGVKGGIELWVKILMPVLFVLLLILLAYATTLDGFGEGLAFVFTPDFSKVTGQSVLAALGQGLFSLSVGMGALIVYGSYLSKRDDVVGASLTVGLIDTVVAILAAVLLFPILFTVGQEPNQGPGLVFVTLPIAFADMPGGLLLAPAFFILLTFAALTSAISLLEVTTSYFIDERGWSRTKAALGTGGLVALLGIPSALAASSKIFGEGVKGIFGMDWLDLFDFVASNIILPLGAMGISIFVAWYLDQRIREENFKAGTKLEFLFVGWVILLRFVVPIAVLFVFLNAIGVLDLFGSETDPVEVLTEPNLPDSAESGADPG